MLVTLIGYCKYIQLQGFIQHQSTGTVIVSIDTVIPAKAGTSVSYARTHKQPMPDIADAL